MWVFLFFSFLICFSINHIDMYIGSFLLSHFSVSLLLLLVDWLVVATGYYYLVSILIFKLWSVFFFLNFKSQNQCLFSPAFKNANLLKVWRLGRPEMNQWSFSISFQISIRYFILHQSCLFWLKIDCVGWCWNTKNFSKKSDCVRFLNYKIDFFFFPLKN